MKKVNEKLFPHEIAVIVTASSPLKIKTKFTKVTAGEVLSMPFSIPEKYDRK
jgi:hypothetical protein